MPEPVFDATDRVATTQTELPAELRGVTDPVKIARYYQEREARLRRELTTQQPPPNTPPTTVRMERPTETPAPATFTAGEAEAARATLIESAKQTAKVGKEYWDRLLPDIEQVMAPLPPEDRVNWRSWDIAYSTVLGMNFKRLQQEDATRAADATRIATERANAAPETVQPPAPLEARVVEKVLPGLGITDKQYRDAQQNIEKGVWPLTFDNTRRS